MSAKKLKENILEGQINLFDLPIQEIIKPKEPVTKCVPEGNNFNEIISLYEKSCNRIVKQVCGALIIELEDRTLYFNKQGVNELELKKDMDLLPADEILIVNKDKELNDLQLKKLKDINTEKYIKRKGDANIIVPLEDKTIVINPKGWVIEYEQKPKYHPNELFMIEMAKEITDLATKSTKVDTNITEFAINDSVEIEYQGIKSTGKVVRVYNNGETINVAWEGKRTAFYYKSVKKVS
jgi:signal peptidase I